MGRPARDLSGRKFGRLTVISRAIEKPSKGGAYWLCACDCGRSSIVRSGPLLAGRSRSCGCWAREMTASRSRKHGMEGTAIYQLWSGMVSRCLNKNHRAYRNYGGRGITVCERWLTFENFYADMGERPRGKSLDRIDNSQGYSPENCRWATHREQCLNTRANRPVSAVGVTLPLSELARQAGIGESTLSSRLASGMEPDAAITQAVRIRGQKAGVDGVVRTITEWARLSGLRPNTVRRRVAAGDRGAAIIRPSRSPIRKYRSSHAQT